MSTTRLRIRLKHVAPVVVRTLDVPSDSTLPELHELFQASLGWTDSHLHRFESGERSWGMAVTDQPEDELDERTGSLKDLGQRFTYLYDFGDDWEHDVEVLGPGGEPALVEGEGACPPEDCGGPPGYQELVKRRSDRIEPFDLARCQRLVDDVLGEVPQPVRVFLDVIADGVKQTQAGKLPPAIVGLVVDRCPHWDVWGSSRRENDVLQVQVLKEVLRDAGLLRLSKGMLTQTKAAATDRGILRALRKRYPSGDFITLLVTDALGMLSGRGPQTDSALMQMLLPMFRFWGTADGRSVTTEHLRDAWYRLHLELVAQDLLMDRALGKQAAGPSARRLLPRAAFMADLAERGILG